jgi:hypothetical protein
MRPPASRTGDVVVPAERRTLVGETTAVGEQPPRLPAALDVVIDTAMLVDD